MHRISVLVCGIVLLMGSFAGAAPSVAGTQAAAARATDPWITRTTKVQFQPQRAARGKAFDASGIPLNELRTQRRSRRKRAGASLHSFS